MTPHYDLKQQEKGGGGHKHFCHISGGGGGRVCFSNGIGRGGGRQNLCLPQENITAPPPTHTHLVINDSSLRYVVVSTADGAVRSIV